MARRGPSRAVERTGLIEALDAGMSAPDIAARFGVSVSAVCRALTRDGLSTLSQIRRRQAAERYATLLTLAEGSPGADGAIVEQLRQPLRSSPGRPGSD